MSQQIAKYSRLALKACATVALVLCASGALPDEASAPAWLQADLDALCVTNGNVSKGPESWLAIETPSSRATVRGMMPSEDQTAEARFRYLGPSQAEKPLASGTLQRQIGMKLQAQDTCNAVYVMWHIEPDTRLMVSIKRNPKMDSQAACGAGGYAFMKPQLRADPPPIRAGETNTLRVELRGLDLVVTANDKVAWRGTLTGPLPTGPVGFQTDNGRFLVSYQFADTARAGGERRAQPVNAERCRPSDAGSGG